MSRFGVLMASIVLGFASALTGPVVAAPGPGGQCANDTLRPGRHLRSMTWEGVDRWYEISVPSTGVGSDSLPVVFNLHPFVLGGNPLFRAVWRHESGLAPLGSSEGFIVVQPDGSGSPTAWNGGDACCGEPSANDVDDVGFIRALLDEVAAETCVDRKRVYATGMSNGGYLSHRLACEASDFIAAIAPVVGSFSSELSCDLTRPVPVLQISGSEDSLQSREASVARWVELNGCVDAPVVTYSEGTATCETWSRCEGGVVVEHCVVEGGGHCWFSDINPQASPGCSATDDLISQEAAWDFFRQWSLPE